jgi:DNA primase
LFESEDIDDYAPPRSTCLYNEHQVLLPLALGDIEELVLVEGMGGAMRVMAAGHSVVATFGTRIAASQRYRLIDALRRAQERRGEPVRVICAQDGDLPGRAAALELLLSLGTYAQCTLAIIPTGKDPEDLSVGELRTCLLESVTLSEAMEDSELRSDLMSAFVSVAETMQRRAR